MLTFVLSVPILLTLAFAQLGNTLVLFGIKPNLVLAFIAAYGVIEKDWLRRIALVIVMLFILKPSAYPALHLIFIGVVILAALALIDALKWQPLINGTLAVVAAALVINLEAFRPGVFVIEAVYDLVLAGMFYLLLAWVDTKLSRHVFT